MGKEVEQFVAKDGGAAWFEDDYRDAIGDLGGEDVQDPAQQTFCAIEETEVVEGASAAEICSWLLDAEAGGFEDVHGGLGGRRMKVVIESIGPEQDVRKRTLVVRRWSLANIERQRINFSSFEPCPKSLVGEWWNAALLRDASYELGNLAQHRKLCRQVGDGGKVGSDARPDIDMGE